MPRAHFTTRSIDAMAAPESGRVDYWDQSLPCFGLRITETGWKSWVVLYRHNGRARRLTLGTYPRLGLADARAAARHALHEIALGADPASSKRLEREADTIGELIREYLERHAKIKKKSWEKDERILNKELLPHLGRVNAKDVTRRDIIRILDAIRDRGAPIMANRSLEVFRKMFNFGIERDIISFNPCYKIPRPSKEVRGERVLTPDEIRILWESLDSVAFLIGAIFKLRLITAQRGGEILSMRWDDLNLANGWWTIPSQFSKNGCSHRVPLTSLSLAILQRLADERDASSWVFPSPKGRGHIEHVYKALDRIKLRTGIQLVGHDLRRTAASGMTSIGVPRFIVSRILNHVDRGITAVYDRHSYDPEKRSGLEAWDRHLQRLIHSEANSPHQVRLLPNPMMGAGFRPDGLRLQVAEHRNLTAPISEPHES